MFWGYSFYRTAFKTGIQHATTTTWTIVSHDLLYSKVLQFNVFLKVKANKIYVLRQRYCSEPLPFHTSYLFPALLSSKGRNTT